MIRKSVRSKHRAYFPNNRNYLCVHDFEIRKGAEKIANYPDTFLLSRSIALDNAKLEILDRSVVPSTTITGPVAQVIELNTVKDIMKYDKELITAKAGTVIQIVLQ